MRNARDYFPRGLAQPEGGYRFAADSLLLACFARAKKRARVADLGCGCGVAGLGLLLRAPLADMTLTGLDGDARMVAAAAENAVRLGLAEHFTAMCADVGRIREEARFGAESFGLVLANPPYRELGRGRISPKGEGVNAARFESGSGLAGFVRAAGFLLKTGGAFYAVGLAERLDATLALLSEARLAPKRLRLVHGRVDAPAKIVLVQAVKNAGPGLRVEPPLVLYEKGQGNRITPDALAFCPFLACNAGRGLTASPRSPS
jgi:tRNA1Val (adenine37-N6)-methyltransferase